MREAVAPDLLGARDCIASKGGRLGLPLVLLRETDSTSEEAKRAAKQGAPHGATWAADLQTRGRGRQGRAWTSPRAEGLLFSVVLRGTKAWRYPETLPLVVGLAVRDVVSTRLSSRDVLLKWPNDVLVANKKVAGVLVEATRECYVVGVGINVSVRQFPPELEGRATSLALEGAEQLSRGALLADVLAALDRDVEHVASFGLGLIHGRLRAVDALYGKAVSGERGSGIARGLSEKGGLIVECDDGRVQEWSSGEVHLVTHL